MISQREKPDEYTKFSISGGDLSLPSHSVNIVMFMSNTVLEHISLLIAFTGDLV